MVIVCSYTNDFGITFPSVRVIYGGEGERIYDIEQIVPVAIKERISQRSRVCNVNLSTRSLELTDANKEEWIFTIPFQPYSSLWDRLLDEIEANPLITSYATKGETIKYAKLNQILDKL